MSESPAAHFTARTINDIIIVTFITPKVGLGVREPLYDLVEKERHQRIILNFENVHFLSSAPIGVLFQLKKMVEAAGGAVRLCCVDPDLRDVFRMTGVERLFDIHATEAEAIAAF